MLSPAHLSVCKSLPEQHRLYEQQRSILSCWTSDYLPQPSISHSRRQSYNLFTSSTANMSRKQPMSLQPSRRLSLCQATNHLINTNRRQSCLPTLSGHRTGHWTIAEGVCGQRISHCTIAEGVSGQRTSHCTIAEGVSGQRISHSTIAEGVSTQRTCQYTIAECVSGKKTIQCTITGTPGKTLDV
jgi:hypothetical protein